MSSYSRLEALRQRGFSLIEVLVSMSIFAIVVTIGVGSLLVLIDANAKAQNTQAVINNVAFAVDSMVRDIRTGYHYYCIASGGAPGSVLRTGDTTTADCPTGGGNFVFTESGGSLTAAEGGRIGFRYNATDESIERCVGTLSATRCAPSGPGWQRITAPDVRIDEFRFVVTGSASSNNVSPVVTVFIAGEAGEVSTVDSSFNLQTTITQQSLDI